MGHRKTDQVNETDCPEYLEGHDSAVCVSVACRRIAVALQELESIATLAR